MMLFAGHGIMKDGMQTLVLNQYCERTQFYKLLLVEKAIRGWAVNYPNAYVIAIFACCR